MVRARVRGLEIGVVLTLLPLAGACRGGTLPLALTLALTLSLPLALTLALIISLSSSPETYSPGVWGPG